jgi:hypothetical protein
MSRLMIIESSNAATDGDRQLQTVLEYAKKMEPASNHVVGAHTVQTQIAHHLTGTTAPPTSAQRARSLIFIRDCLQMDGIEFAVQVARDNVRIMSTGAVEDRQYEPDAPGEDYGVVVMRQAANEEEVVLSCCTHIETDIYRTLWNC